MNNKTPPPRYSRLALLLCYALLLGTAIFYYPKWEQPNTEATLSWDVSGYYFYLPAAFIYKDLKQAAFKDEIQEKYRPASGPYQVFEHPSGNYVMKYSAGLAVQYLPFFLAAHAIAEPLGYPADGFSKPYQAAISFGSLLMALLGLYMLRRILLRYFSDGATAASLLTIVFATNYLNYSTIDGAMTHNWLFTLYALLLWQSIRFYERPGRWRAVAIGGLVGLMALTRPTEIIACLIPLLWGIDSWGAARERLGFFTSRRGLLLLALAAVVMGAVGSIQPIYWKYVTGEWIVYSYQDQGFSWLRPHVWDGLFSFKAGWLIYSPAMALALLGFVPLFFRRRQLFWHSLAFVLLFMYITFAWDIWWYGGSVGQRAMVQAYPVLAFPLAAFFSLAEGRAWLRYLLVPLLLLLAYYNLWITHQAHRGGLFQTEQMTAAYWKAIFLRYEVPEETIKLLDTDELFSGTPENERILLEENFESDTLPHQCPVPPIEGQRSFCLTKEQQFTPAYRIPYQRQSGEEWIRVAVTVHCPSKEWNYWTMTQLIARMLNGEEKVKERQIRLHRLLHDGQTRRLHLDVRLPDEPFDAVEVLLWHAEGQKVLVVDELVVRGFGE
jgi:hypothetical protein